MISIVWNAVPKKTYKMLNLSPRAKSELPSGLALNAHGDPVYYVIPMLSDCPYAQLYHIGYFCSVHCSHVQIYLFKCLASFPFRLVLWNKFNPSMGKLSHPLSSKEWNYLFIPEIQRRNYWILEWIRKFVSCLLGIWSLFHVGKGKGSFLL